jgi:serine/threonine protein kinase
MQEELKLNKLPEMLFLPQMERFIIIKNMGSQVKLAIDQILGKRVALKFYGKRNDLNYAEIYREFSVLRLLSHPNIVQTYDVFVCSYSRI